MGVSVDLFSTLRVFGRRWYAIAPVLMLAVVAELLIPSRIPVSYRSVASILLVPPSAPATTTSAGTNPYLNFDQSLVVASNVLARSLNAPATVERLVRDGAKATFTATPPASDVPNPSPIVEVVVEGDEAIAVRKTALIVVAAVEDELKSQQQASGAPTSSYIRAVVVSRDADPIAVNGNRYRATAAIAALAVVLLAAMAFLVEAIEVRRGRKAQPDGLLDASLNPFLLDPLALGKPDAPRHEAPVR
jgi:hypothetical protein